MRSSRKCSKSVQAKFVVFIHQSMYKLLLSHPKFVQEIEPDSPHSAGPAYPLSSTKPSIPSAGTAASSLLQACPFPQARLSSLPFHHRNILTTDTSLHHRGYGVCLNSKQPAVCHSAFTHAQSSAWILSGLRIGEVMAPAGCW